MFDVESSRFPQPTSMLSVERLKFSTLQWLCAAAKATAGVFYLVGRDLRQSQFLTYNVDLSFHHRYVKDLHQLDPLHPRHFPAPDERIVTLSDALPPCFRRQSEYFRIFVAPQSIHDIIEIFLRHEGRIVAGVSLLKYQAGPPLAAQDVRLLRAVHPLIEDYLGTVIAASDGAEREPSAERYALTERERVTVELIEDGLSNKEIARRLGISVATVKTHVRSILSKTQTTSRATLLAKLFRH
ncbi:MAG TPA: LuxR C-terminal-related transcriptional regulator [Steroidobacteraceae bacterium]|nr:LuxR C-terminal-related transcriptional regulator [Steroidobacteraceae bacterium]